MGKSKFIAPDALIFMPHGFKRTIERRDLAALARLRIRNSESIDSRIFAVFTLLSPFNSPLNNRFNLVEFFYFF